VSLKVAKSQRSLGRHDVIVLPSDRQPYPRLSSPPPPPDLLETSGQALVVFLVGL
jgi:hypothetical protein